MIVIDRQRTTYAVAVIKDCSSAGLSDFVVWVTDSLGVNALRIAEQTPHEIQIMDRMHGDLDTRQTFEERPQTPRGRKRQPCIEIHHFAKQALIDGIVKCQHHWRETQLKIHRSFQITRTADLQDFRSSGKITAHRLLNETGRTFRQLRKDRSMG